MSESPTARGHLDACLNCEAELAGPYCPRCGQRNVSRRLDARQIAHDVASHLFQLESTIPRTILELSRNPGRVAREYAAGRRVRYVNPFKYCITLTALFFVWNAFLGVDLTEATMRGFEPESPRQAEVIAGLKDFVFTHVSNVIFIALPIFALLLRRVFRKAGYNFAETYAFVLFVTGHVALVGLAFSALEKLMSLSMLLPVRTVFHVAFFVWAAVGFYRTPPLAGALKALAAHFAYMAIVAVLASLLAFGYLVSAVGLEGLS